jgi:hypothetical protein
MVKPNLDNWKLNLEDIHWIENALGYRLQRLSMKRLTVKKQSSKDNIDNEIRHITELQGKMFNQKEWRRAKIGDTPYISG